MTFDQLIASFRGVVVFAWLPVRVCDRSGFFFERIAWLRPVLKRRAIGWDRYFYTEVGE